MISLIAKKEISAVDISINTLAPSFRKATMNMVLAHSACENVLKAVPDISRDDITFIVATHFGEVQSTLDFLSTYCETQIPSPILFQNSLHNSTLGFVAIQLNLMGPALTISLAEQTQDSLTLLVESMLDLGRAVIICFVDFIPQELHKHYLENFPFLKNTLNKAIAFAFVKPDVQSGLKLDELPFQKFF